MLNQSTDSPALSLTAKSAKSAVADLVTMTTALLVMRHDAIELKGPAKSRATQAVKDQSAIVLSIILQDAALRSARIAVGVVSTLRGDRLTQTVTVPCIDVVRAVAFGGAVVGSAKLA